MCTLLHCRCQWAISFATSSQIVLYCLFVLVYLHFFSVSVGIKVHIMWFNYFDYTTNTYRELMCECAMHGSNSICLCFLLVFFLFYFFFSLDKRIPFGGDCQLLLCFFISLFCGCFTHKCKCISISICMLARWKLITKPIYTKCVLLFWQRICHLSDFCLLFVIRCLCDHHFSVVCCLWRTHTICHFVNFYLPVN